MEDHLQDLLITIIKDSLRELGWDKFLKEDLYLDLSSEERFGDLSTNIALRLSQFTKKTPFETATCLLKNIEEHLEKSPVNAYVKEVKAEGVGFINFYIKDIYFYEQIKTIILKGKKTLKINIGKGKNTLVEFVSANPTGPLSVAHARQAAVGDVLSNILNFLGFIVKREYYLNDEGNQIDMLGKSIELRYKELSGQSLEFPQNYYQGSYIYDIAREIKNKKLKIKNFAEYGVKEILKIIKKELNDFGVKFDYWYSQKNLRKSGKIKRALRLLKKKGFIYEEDGALWFKSSQFQDDKDRVVVKSDGTYTYLAPDIAYHQEKYRRGFKFLINLWGPDHHGYINRLRATVMALGHSPKSLSIIIVQLVSILRDGLPQQMSTRKGKYITLREVLDEVGLDASRFFFLMRRTSSHLDFDLSLAKKQTPENPVYYIQYAHARISSILRNERAKIKFKEADFTLLKEKEEIGLIKKIWQFPYTLHVCFKTLDPYMLTVYLQELAQDFHKFYDAHRVLGQNSNLTRARLSLIKATQTVISSGLELLGVSRPEEM